MGKTVRPELPQKQKAIEGRSTTGPQPLASGPCPGQDLALPNIRMFARLVGNQDD